MIVDGPGYFFRFSLSFCIQTADDPLQLCELTDHVRGQIALRELRRAISVGDIGVMNSTRKPLLGKPACQSAHALDLVAIASQLRLEGDLVKFWQIVGEPTFLVGFPEELGVGETRTQDAFMSGAHQSAGIAIQIDDRKEMRRQSCHRDVARQSTSDGRA